MSDSKNINYFSIDSANLRELAGAESHVFNNDDLSIILNGRPSDKTFFREGEVYQLPEPRLLLFMSGEADVHLDLEQYHFERGTVILTTPDVILEFERIGQDVEVCGIAMKEAVQVTESIVTKVSAKDSDLLLRMMYLLWDMAALSPYRREAVLQMVRAMVADVQYIKQASDSSVNRTAISRHQELFQQFKTLVSHHCERERNIPYYADLLRITPHHLSAVISRASGRSAMYWINRAVVLRAKVLLRTSGLLTYEIAERLHFANPPAFNNFFKRETGLTPNEYRERK
jgi:YesN/AraC family two-component response regulator